MKMSMKSEGQLRQRAQLITQFFDGPKEDDSRVLELIKEQLAWKYEEKTAEDEQSSAA